MKILTRVTCSQAWVICAMLCLVLLVGMAVYGQSPGVPVTRRGQVPEQPTACESDEAAVLPTISSSTAGSSFEILPKLGVSAEAPLIQGAPSQDADDYKVLYGYHGPYFNIDSIDDQVTVLTNSLYTWSIATWKTTGMLRNQMPCSVRIKAIRARLLNARGEVVDIATSDAAVSDLRPGEPSPFEIDSIAPRMTVRSVKWEVDYEYIPKFSRPFTFEIYSTQASKENGYLLFGSITNAGKESRPARMIAAWIDSANRVVYLASPKIAFVASSPDHPEYRDEVNLDGRHFENFVYTTKDQSLAALLDDSTVALWGISK